MAAKSTTIKLSKHTKSRLDHLQVYPKEPYERILSRMLEILNTCRLNPLKSRAMLLAIDKQRKMNGLNHTERKQPQRPQAPEFDDSLN